MSTGATDGPEIYDTVNMKENHVQTLHQEVLVDLTEDDPSQPSNCRT